MIKKLKRLYWNYSEDLGLALWIIVFLIISTLVWLLVDKAEAFFR